jgi:hypothetical protein
MGKMGEQGVEPVEFGYRELEPGCRKGVRSAGGRGSPPVHGAGPESSSAPVWTAP